MTAMTPALTQLQRLIEIMATLRNPNGGCPWDLEQTFETIAPYTLEEAYEVYDAINRGDMGELKDELGDLLLQIVFHAQMAHEQALFSIADVAQSISDKMVRRHPHIFDAETGARSADAVSTAWEDIKAAERSAKRHMGALSGVALALPALTRAEKLQRRAARTGFDWPEAQQIFDKLEEEIDEVKEAVANEDRDNTEEEIGDLLFVCVNLARKLKIDPEAALRRANDKFESRFHGMEALAQAEGITFSELSLDEQEAFWQRVKQDERAKFSAGIDAE